MKIQILDVAKGDLADELQKRPTVTELKIENAHSHGNGAMFEGTGRHPVYLPANYVSGGVGCHVSVDSARRVCSFVLECLSITGREFRAAAEPVYDS